MKRSRIVLVASLAAALLTGAYTIQATMKLKRSLGPDLTLSDCRFSVYTERADLGALSLPIPKLACTASPRNDRTLEYVWLPSRNAWVKG